MNNQKRFYSPKGAIAWVMFLLAKDANDAATEQSSSGCGYQPGDSFLSYDLNLDGRDCLVSTDIPYSINDLGTGTILQCIWSV